MNCKLRVKHLCGSIIKQVVLSKCHNWIKPMSRQQRMSRASKHTCRHTESEREREREMGSDSTLQAYEIISAWRWNDSNAAQIREWVSERDSLQLQHYTHTQPYTHTHSRTHSLANGHKSFLAHIFSFSAVESIECHCTGICLHTDASECVCVCVCVCLGVRIVIMMCHDMASSIYATITITLNGNCK